MWGFGLAADGIKVVGHVKGGLPDVSIDRWTQPIADMADMTTTAALVTIVSCPGPNPLLFGYTLQFSSQMTQC